MKTKLYIEIEVEHDEECDPSDALDHLLDAGDLQDALIGYCDAQGHTIEVTGCYEISWPEVSIPPLTGSLDYAPNTAMILGASLSGGDARTMAEALLPPLPKKEK